MGVYGGPDISENVLVLALDGANYKSFKGEETTNLIPSSTINAYPTTGNGWGTYNTNQYNGGAYFSIGTVNDVTNNIITMTSAHTLRTYDVMQPQTSGGGVSAGVNYFIKKVSNTSFTLHEYNSSQDGSQGYINPSTGTHKVYDSIATDTRISVNSASFPTMWWGYPHQPNSGLVKELRYGEFNAIPNLPANDCIRLHYIRTDDVKDGMAYGVNCTVTPSSPITVSFYTRAANANAVGKTHNYLIYNYTGGSFIYYNFYFTLGQVGVWERQTFTFTPANSVIISYWFAASSGVYAWDWSCMQVEQKSYATRFVPGTRGTTISTGGGWADLSGNSNNGQLVNGVRESGDNIGSLVFDGVDDSVRTSNNISFGNNCTWECWVNRTSSVNPYNMFMGRFLPYFGIQDGGIIFSNNINSSQQTLYSTGFTPSNNTWYYLTFTTEYNGTNTISKIYINGVLNNSATFSGSQGEYSLPFTIGDGYGYVGTWYPFNGRISNTKIYTRALSASEIRQNFNALRGRYGI
jgi:hypothetical protein